MKINKIPNKTMFLITFLVTLFIISQLVADDFEIVSLTTDTPPGAKTMVLLKWNEVPGIDGINIYRKTGLMENYSRNPLNELPITIITDCSKIRELIPSGSDELMILENLPWEKSGTKPGDLTLYNPSSMIRLAGFDPCKLAELDQSSALWEDIQFLARRFYPISIVLGQSFTDNNVNSGTDYWYEVRAVSGRSETVLASDIMISAGINIPLPAPSNIQVTAGDSEVLITWDNVTNAFGYDVYRKVIPHGFPVKINDAPVMAVITQDLDGDSLAATMGIVDYRRWDETGYPITHDVDGSPVSGPTNGTHYKYQVVALDGLEQPGTASSFSAMVMPVDTTAPGLPGDLSVEAVGQTLKITWSKVTKDKLGRMEMDGINGYNIYRAETQSEASPVKLNLMLIPQPAGTEVQFIDNDPAIISHYGEKEFYYRIDCTDIHSNQGEMSSTASGFVPDIYAPDPPKNTSAEGFQEYIRVFWEFNSEPDIYSYEIYRSLCHLGEWLDPRQQKEREISSGDFVLIGEITHKEAVEIATSYGQTYLDDYTVPAGSPLCYAYWVKARDGSQNLSGGWPYPDPGEISLIVCQRLRDENPPPPPIVTAVQARDEAIYLEWIAAPSQDLGVFHIYRSEKENTDYKWVGGITVEEPPTSPVILAAPFAPSKPCSCDVIPLVAHDGMNAGFFYDKDVEAKVIYYYKILAVDQNGNESSLDESIPYSSFTYKISGPQQPVISSVISLSDSCGLSINWTPVFDASTHLGYIVFRSSSQDGVFRQISPMLKDSEYNDKSVNEGVFYWYKVQSLDLDGRPSVLSASYKAKFQ